eukprot:COSAG05_NODE_12762_length_455_cov_1.323034_2_plen_46_part_01
MKPVMSESMFFHSPNKLVVAPVNGHLDKLITLIEPSALLTALASSL